MKNTVNRNYIWRLTDKAISHDSDKDTAINTYSGHIKDCYCGLLCIVKTEGHLQFYLMMSILSLEVPLY